MGKGKVLCAETHPLIGNYVAVDHGMGLITWYCNMSEIKVSLGDEVNIGTSVGASGDTGFDGINGVYFITTVNGVPISPYPLQ